jgi:hypothetical protein
MTAVASDLTLLRRHGVTAVLNLAPSEVGGVITDSHCVSLSPPSIVSSRSPSSVQPPLILPPCVTQVVTGPEFYGPGIRYESVPAVDDFEANVLADAWTTARDFIDQALDAGGKVTV